MYRISGDLVCNGREDHTAGYCNQAQNRKSFKLEYSDGNFLAGNVWILSGWNCGIGDSKNASVVFGSGNFVCSGDSWIVRGRRLSDKDDEPWNFYINLLE